MYKCAEVKKKASRVLRILQRNLSSCSKAVKQRAYLALVRPTLEYATPAWSPHTKKDINNIESVQRLAARFVCGDYIAARAVSPKCSSLFIGPCFKIVEDKDLEMFYKIEKGMVNIPFPEELIKRHTNTRGHRQRYIQIGGSINAYQHSFFVRTVPKWNALPAVAVEAISLAAFKNEISVCK